MALLSNRTDRDSEASDYETRGSETDESDGSATTVLPARTSAATGSAQVDERLAARRRLEARAAAATATTTTAERAPVTVGRDGTTELVVAGPRSRASVMATLSLVLGLISALTVLTGVLAGPGVGVGLLAAFAAIGGMAATSRPHVAGKGNAMLGLLLGLAGIVVGTLTLTGNLPWLNADTDQVMRVRDWLDAQAPWLFPNS